MFTGIVETIGEVQSATPVDGDVRLIVIATDFKERDVAIGDSIAINGACLTVIEHNAEQSSFAFDVSVESINHTLIGDWGAGTKVNLEMALLPTTRLGGHLVSGHVDGLARLTELSKDARSWRMVFEAPADLKKYIAKKGSVTLNGTSLTVNSVDDKFFDINVIPHTFEVTTLGELKIDDQVHIEVDLLARYLERLTNS
ncbi:UNVERIFIED_CONTAM: hypothetical protein GTU68_034110 [Idotea baltica]|nr:hypothetical protein [Idotea baltica]